MLIIVQKCKSIKKEILSQLIWHLIRYNWSSIDYSVAPERCQVPISIVAVNPIEVFERIDRIYSELNIYGGGFEPLISSCTDFSYKNKFSYKLKEDEQFCLIGMLDAAMRNNDYIDQNSANEVC